jgi:hypothetical protein
VIGIVVAFVAKRNDFKMIFWRVTLVMVITVCLFFAPGAFKASGGWKFSALNGFVDGVSSLIFARCLLDLDVSFGASFALFALLFSPLGRASFRRLFVNVSWYFAAGFTNRKSAVVPAFVAVKFCDWLLGFAGAATLRYNIGSHNVNLGRRFSCGQG